MPGLDAADLVVTVVAGHVVVRGCKEGVQSRIDLKLAGDVTAEGGGASLHDGWLIMSVPKTEPCDVMEGQIPVRDAAFLSS